MSDNKWARTIADLQKELGSIENSSRGVSKRFQNLQRQAEFLKIEFLKYSLENQKTAAMRQRGFTFLIKDKKKVKTGLAVAVGSFFLGGLLSKDKDVALTAGLSSFDGLLQGFGETIWAVSLQKALVVVPDSTIPAKGIWVTFESLFSAIDDLKTEALQGKRLGTFDNIIQKLQQSKGKLIHVGCPIELRQNDVSSL
jgi:hypothetical protein